jgi:hypothetical protein
MGYVSIWGYMTLCPFVVWGASEGVNLNNASVMWTRLCAVVFAFLPGLELQVTWRLCA